MGQTYPLIRNHHIPFNQLNCPRHVTLDAVGAPYTHEDYLLRSGIRALPSLKITSRIPNRVFKKKQAGFKRRLWTVISSFRRGRGAQWRCQNWKKKNGKTPRATAANVVTEILSTTKVFPSPFLIVN